MNETKQFCVTVKVYTWAESAHIARDQVIAELEYLCSVNDSPITGFVHPSVDDVEEDKEV
jgi:hypothetical protein